MNYKKFIPIYLLTTILFFCYTTAFASEQKILAARISTTENNTRVVLVLNQVPQFHGFVLQNPDRFVLDLNNIEQANNTFSLDLHSSVIKAIRQSAHEGNNLRIVFDLKNSVTAKEFILADKNESHPRLVLDLTEAKNTDISSVIQSVTNDAPTLNINTELPSAVSPTIENNVSDKPIVAVQTKIQKRDRDIIIVIDPGHGGKDPGASGPHRVHEKQVVLSIAQTLQERLNRTPGFRAVLTRDRDYFIPLRNRLSIARNDKADLFVAIHADAYINNNSQGASVYALSERGASSEAARWLAERENYSELGGVQRFSDKSYMVRSVLLDLSQTVTITESLQMGRLILNSLSGITPLHHNKVEQARFVVLKSPDIPSLLVETGFITNPREESRLNSVHYQGQLANALAKGIENYFSDHPPPGTQLAESKRVKIYVVDQGDTLQAIADRYGITAKEIASLNHLWSNRVHSGQKLRIPMDEVG